MTIKAGLIGAGAVTPLYMETIHPLDFVQMEALAEVNMELAQRRAKQLQIPRAYDDYRELLEDSRIEAVHILLPNSLHFEVIKAALQARKHVIAEKPLTTTVEEARELIVLERQTHLVTAINFHYRYFNLVQEAKEMVAEGELGKVRLVQGSYCRTGCFSRQTTIGD